MSDIKINETIENEIIELFEKNIVNPVIEKNASKDQIDKLTEELDKKTSELSGYIKDAENRILSEAYDLKSVIVNSEKEIASDISCVNITVNNQNNAINDLAEQLELKSQEIIERINSFSNYSKKVNKIKYGLIGAIGGIITILEILILVLK